VTEDVIKALASFTWEIARVEIERDTVRESKNATALVLYVVDRADPGHRVAASFSGVTDLRFSQLSSNLLIHPQMASMEERGWEGVKYSFTDPPDNLLKFYFVEAVLIDQTWQDAQH
jgi:hypothetical protein